MSIGCGADTFEEVTQGRLLVGGQACEEACLDVGDEHDELGVPLVAGSRQT